MLKKAYAYWKDGFTADHAVFWANLTRLNNLLVIMNISLFFLTGLVAKGYFYTIISVACLGMVSIASIFPSPLMRRLGYYLVFLVFEVVGIYFLVNSIFYWVRTGTP